MLMEFPEADRWQREMRDTFLRPLFYEAYCCSHCSFLSGDHVLQKYGVDTVVRSDKQFKLVTIDEKFVRWPRDRDRPYTCFALETWSCTVCGRRREGWMASSVAEFLFYCFVVPKEMVALDAYLIKLQALKEWFWRLENAGRFPSSVSPQINHTQCAIVPIEAVCSSGVPVWRYRLWPGKDIKVETFGVGRTDWMHQ